MLDRLRITICRVIAILFALALIAMGIWWASVPLSKTGRIVGQLKPVDPYNSTSVSGLVMITGMPIDINLLKAPITNLDCAYYDYRFERSEYFDGDYRTITDKQQTVWSEFSIGEVLVRLKNAQPYLKLDKKVFDRGINTNGEKIREVLVTAELPQIVTIVGRVNNKVLSEGELSIISSGSPEDLKKKINEQEMAVYWISRICFFFLFVYAIKLIFEAIEHNLTWVPILGWVDEFKLNVVNIILSLFLVTISSIFREALWLGGIIVAGIILMMSVASPAAEDVASDHGANGQF
jgi:hypothetical protein